MTDKQREEIRNKSRYLVNDDDMDFIQRETEREVLNDLERELGKIKPFDRVVVLNFIYKMKMEI